MKNSYYFRHFFLTLSTSCPQDKVLSIVKPRKLKDSTRSIFVPLMTIFNSLMCFCFLWLLVHTLVMVRLDYCNVFLCGVREHVIRQLERLQRQAARVVCKKYKNDHISVTELMWGLYWLLIRARIQYKILLLVYKAFTNGSPTYLADMMTSCNPVRSTRSSHKMSLLVVPHQKSSRTSSMERTINRRASRLQQRRHCQKEARNYALQKHY